MAELQQDLGNDNTAILIEVCVGVWLWVCVGGVRNNRLFDSFYWVERVGLHHLFEIFGTLLGLGL